MNLGMPEMIFIFLLALVIFGPRKLPELGRQLGKALGEFKKASNEFKNQLEVEMMNIELEERAKQPAEPSPRILPAEKSLDAIAAPPIESVPRATLAAHAEGVTPEPEAGNLAAESVPSVAIEPAAPNVSGQNA